MRHIAIGAVLTLIGAMVAVIGALFGDGLLFLGAFTVAAAGSVVRWRAESRQP